MGAKAIVGAALMLAGCGHLPLGRRTLPRGSETITYSFTGSPLCGLGQCHSYSVTLGPDEQGILTDADGHDQRFRATSVETRNFGQALASFRPSGERLIIPKQPNCCRATADGITVNVRWQAADLPPAHLQIYSGCMSASARRLNDALRGLPMSLLPLQSFLGSD